MPRDVVLPDHPGVLAEQLSRALTEAELVPLLAAIAYITGDVGILDDELRVDPLRMREPQSGYSDQQIAVARERAVRALTGFVAGGQVVAAPSRAQFARIVAYIAAEEVPERFHELLTEELAADGDRRAPRWRAEDLDPQRRMRVLIIGAGMSGIALGHRLLQAGVEVTLVERNGDVGGTWLDNTYPGCRVDNPNQMYSYSFAQRGDWPYSFSPQPVLRQYFRDCAERFGVLDRVRLHTEAVTATWDEVAGAWQVVVTDPSGTHTITAEVLVSAVGQLNQPLIPDLPGAESFTGPAFHSARWDHAVELRGRRVAVIGTGASACQFIPHVVAQAATTTIFQRNPPWLIPMPTYQAPVTPGQQWVFDHVPLASRWFRLWLFWRMSDGLMPAAIVDPDFPPTETSVSATNELWREMLQSWIDLQTDGDPVLREQMTPRYPPFAKRCIIDDGSFIAALRQPGSRVCTEAIAAIEARGVRTVSGELIEADVLIYGTGFQASDFLTPLTVTGRAGADLHRQWAGDATAYLGMMVPNFPNFFCMYGPNTNIVVNGSIIVFSECEAHYITESLRLLLERGWSSIEPTAQATRAFVAEIDAANRLRTWTFSRVSSWYKNATGRSAQNWPFSVAEYWARTRRPDPGAWVTSTRPGGATTE